MSNYKIKLEDKAALLNRLDKQDIILNTSDIIDNKLEGYFEFNVNDPQVDEAIKTILKQSPKIDVIKESKLNKYQLIKMIREELYRITRK